MTVDPRALAVAVAILLLSSIPVALGYVIAPGDRHFMGIVSDVPDWAEYRGWMHAFATRVVIDNPLTCEVRPPAFFNLQWFLLGRLGRWLPLPVVLEGFRLLAGGLFLLASWRVCRSYFTGNRPAQWTAWLLINAAAGFGWIWVLEKRLTGASDAKHPFDIYIAEPVTFQNIMIFPHFVVAALLLLLIFRTAALSIDRRQLRWAFLSTACALLLGLSHGYDLIIVYAVLGAYLVCLWWRMGVSWFPAFALGGIVALSAPPPAYFAILTTTDPLWRKVLAQFGDAGVFTPSPPHLLILVGLPLLLTLGTLPTLWTVPSGTTWPLLLRIWCAVNLPLVYIPVGFQVHMLGGWQIPLGILAAEGVFTRVVPWLREAAQLGTRGARAARWLTRSPWTIVIVLITLAVPTNLYLLAWRTREVARLDHDHFLHGDELAALAWLDRHSDDTDVVLASLTLGQHVPGLIGNRAYVVHWAQTVEFRAKRRAVAAYFRSDTPPGERRDILHRCNVKYVLHGRAERALGGFDPADSTDLRLVFAHGATRVFEVTSGL